MSLQILDPALHKAVGDPKQTNASANKLAEESITTKNVKLPKRKKLKKFVVKEHNYNIEKSY